VSPRVPRPLVPPRQADELPSYGKFFLPKILSFSGPFLFRLFEAIFIVSFPLAFTVTLFSHVGPRFYCGLGVSENPGRPSTHHMSYVLIG